MVDAGGVTDYAVPKPVNESFYLDFLWFLMLRPFWAICQDRSPEEVKDVFQKARIQYDKLPTIETPPDDKAHEQGLVILTKDGRNCVLSKLAFEILTLFQSGNLQAWFDGREGTPAWDLDMLWEAIGLRQTIRPHITSAFQEAELNNNPTLETARSLTVSRFGRDYRPTRAQIQKTKDRKVLGNPGAHRISSCVPLTVEKKKKKLLESGAVRLVVPFHVTSRPGEPFNLCVEREYGADDYHDFRNYLDYKDYIARDGAPGVPPKHLDWPDLGVKMLNRGKRGAEGKLRSIHWAKLQHLKEAFNGAAQLQKLLYFASINGCNEFSELDTFTYAATPEIRRLLGLEETPPSSRDSSPKSSKSRESVRTQESGDDGGVQLAGQKRARGDDEPEEKGKKILRTD
ncbi:hypothetical protein HDU93_000883 [Gonapodya sp. JEL0774]|nr:hypothetical protein HDU93_000883 [Gonapodya sp. JEL0774]